MTMIVNRWYFPVFAISAMTLFYLNDSSSITPVGAILIMVLSFIGLGITERLDNMIKQNSSMVEELKEIEGNTRTDEIVIK